MLEYLLIPAVIISWPMGNVPPVVITSEKVVSYSECHAAQEQIMYGFTEKYPHLWNSMYTGVCIQAKESL